MTGGRGGSPALLLVSPGWVRHSQMSPTSSLRLPVAGQLVAVTTAPVLFRLGGGGGDDVGMSRNGVWPIVSFLGIRTRGLS